jgi:DNA polymerase III epsilon subunit-like protein
MRTKRPRFAVVDVETTGLSAKRDRVVDLCAVLLDEDGVTESVLSTLVKTWPLQSTAPAEAYREAPDFASLAPALCHALNGRILVGHNVRFDVALLAAEFRRVGVELSCPDPIDTVELDRRLAPEAAGRSLSQVSLRHGLAPFAWHTAEADALATSAIFRIQMKSLGEAFQVGRGVVSFLPMPEAGEVLLVPRDVELFPPSTVISEPRSEDPLPESYRMGDDDSAFDEDERQALEELEATINRLNQTLSEYMLRPEVQQRIAEKEARLKAAGLPTLNEIQNLWQDSAFRGRAGLAMLNKVIEGFRAIEDPDLPHALFKKIKRLTQMGRPDEGVDAMTELLELLKEEDDEDLVMDLLYWLEGHPTWTITWMPSILPLVEKSDEHCETALFSLIGAAEKAGASDIGLANILLDFALEYLARSPEDRIYVLHRRFAILRVGDVNGAIALVLDSWPSVEPEMAAWTIDKLWADRRSAESLAVAHKALKLFPDDGRVRAAAGRVLRASEALD